MSSSEKEKLFAILICEMKMQKKAILHSEFYTVMQNKIFNKKKCQFINENEISFLELARLFLALNSRASYTQALNIAIQTISYEYKEQRLLIHKIIKLAQESNYFNEEEIIKLTLRAKPKCDLLLRKENKK
ncbi:hypothetical protein AVCANL279_07300 [Campylobacter canadensis]|uniref:hypothetical protein n=1 Tax=Campylobacter canadensis TaxID=449520 RepID=UPI0015537854|nr:hypothetical protein [Campylobacter canadensis]MBZ7995179.1 hypothetical protein [Campylobacter canadensis]MBZ7997124.1 hypothetical protein [Campylobacter canadensis]MBZ8000543.1 hypothetical protein [Campylobacter canadensis]MBZ8003854.1 hypothetical protein [Campylobacter canadensis]